MCSSYILRVQICRLVPLRVLESKMITVIVILVPFRVLGQNMTELVPLGRGGGGGNPFEPKPIEQDFDTFRVFLKMCDDHLSFYFYTF